MNFFALITFASAFCLGLADVRESGYHHHMAPHELRSVFNVDSHSKVPEYNVVQLHLVSAPNSEAHFKATLKSPGYQNTLNLKLNEDMAKGTPVYELQAGPDGDWHSRPEYLTDGIGRPYHDVDNGAAVTLTKDQTTGAVLMNGFILDNLVVYPIPQSVTDGENARQRVMMNGSYYSHKLFPSMSKKLTGDHFHLQSRRKRSSAVSLIGDHFVYRQPAQESHSDYLEISASEVASLRLNLHDRSNRILNPSEVFIELLIIVDYETFKLHHEDKTKLKTYLLSFFNGVDLRFRNLESPSVKLYLSGIVIAMSDDATSYLERNSAGFNTFDAGKALSDFGKYISSSTWLPDHDAALLLTKKRMCYFAGSSQDKCTTRGLAYVGGACVKGNIFGQSSAVTIVQDVGAFTGVVVAAHEIGHLLGSVHDGKPPSSYVGGTGGLQCRSDDGYLMSTKNRDRKSWQFSRCSIDQFHLFLNGDRAACLHNRPSGFGVIPYIPGGYFLTLDMQCQKQYGTSFCPNIVPLERVCGILYCFDRNGNGCTGAFPAAEGSDCGVGKVCSDGECLAARDAYRALRQQNPQLADINRIPDYMIDVSH